MFSEIVGSYQKPAIAQHLAERCHIVVASRFPLLPETEAAAVPRYLERPWY
jgi:hypothetical protein